MTGSGLAADELRAAFAVAVEWLAANREAINAINVYPVPDGDTGTNMLLTLRAALDAAEGVERVETTGLEAWGAAFARGALLGARGNSGVILSQMFRGLCAAFEGRQHLDGAGLAHALGSASEAAYAALSEPIEGTMLTVLRDAAQAATALGSAATPLAVLTAARAEADASVARTPELLPRLRAAGVVDAGGLGVAVIIEGLRLALAGEPLPAVAAAEPGRVAIDAVEHEGHGFCVEYLVDAGAGVPLDRSELRATLSALGGESVLVVGDAQSLHVHLHLADPQPALAVGHARGTVSAVKTEDMQAQHRAWLAGHEARAAAAPKQLEHRPLGLVAVAAGSGLAEALRSLGAVVVQPRDSAKPSAGELIEAIRSTNATHVLLLPNDKDALLAAEQAAAAEPGRITVIPTQSVAAGMTAALAYTSNGSEATVGEAMRTAIARVRTVEVTRAARPAQLDGVSVAEDDPIALLDGVLLLRADSLEAALIEAVRRAAGAGADAETVTVYLGADAPADALERLPALLHAAFPALIVEVMAGGQPHYPYIAGVE